jgi:hypothetical protein
MPILSEHLSTRGRNAALVKVAQDAARRFGYEAVRDGMDRAELLAKSVAYSTDEMVRIGREYLQYEGLEADEIVCAALLLASSPDSCDPPDIMLAAS